MLLREIEASPDIGEEGSLLAGSTLDCVRRVIDVNPSVCAIELRGYNYVPDTPSGAEELVHFVGREAFLSGDFTQWFINYCCGGGENLPFWSMVSRQVVLKGKNWNVAVGSRVILNDNALAHIPMLDLSAQKSPANLALVIEAFKQRVVPEYGGGLLIETGSSYHFLGQRLLSEQEWHKFNYLALTLAVVYPFERDGVTPNIFGWSNRIVDTKYIGYSGLRGSSGLRISTNGVKTFKPKVVAVV